MRVAVCDDHRLFAETIGTVLETRGLDVVAITASLTAGVDAALVRQPDVCVFDLHFPEGTSLGAIRYLREAVPGTKLVVLSGSADPALLDEARRAGAHGWVRKDDRVEEIVTALRRVHSGELVHGAVFDRGSVTPRRTPSTDAARLAAYLTNRERDVLQRLVRGESTAAIAAGLSVSSNTARSHIQNVLAKLGVHTRLEAAAFAVKHGVVEPVGRQPGPAPSLQPV